ncbi:MAG: B12-binding domain-containing protein [Flexilinea sp.]|jgi:methylmalonyl-CoA mutase cobalamin-binding domain/chain
MSEEIIGKLKQAVLDGDEETARESAQAAIDTGMDPLEIVKRSIQPAMDEIGIAFQEGEAYLPELIIAGDAATKALEIIMSRLAEKGEGYTKGTVVLGVMYGDNHDIGKNLVLAVLSANGFKVIDLGVNVQPKRMVEAAIKENADIIACSTLITTSLPYTRELIELLKAMGKREDYFCIFGGGPVTPEWIVKTGADGYGRDAKDAASLCIKLMEVGSRKKMTEPIIENALISK